MRDDDPTSVGTRLPQVVERDDLDRIIAERGASPRSCVLCEGENLERVFRRSGKWFWKCRDCELVFVHDIYPEFLFDTEHLDEYYSLNALRSADAKRLRKYDKLLPLFEPFRRSGRFLEVGCGQGLFLDHVRNAGWEVCGVDVLAPVAKLARQRGLDIVTGELFDAGYGDGCFDVVYMGEVIEHVVDPVPMLKEVFRVLRPGGAAFVGTGNAGSWAARVRGRRWAYYSFDGLMHIRFYSPKTAEALAQRAGFTSVACRTSGFAFLEADEMRGHWYKPIVKLGQNIISPLAGPASAGHRLMMVFRRAP